MPGWLAWTHSKALLKTAQEEALKQLGIRHFDEDLLAMDIATLRKHFGYPTTDSIQVHSFLLNVIWQLHEHIQAGNPPDFYKKHGFIRGMWYHIKGRIARYKPLRGHYYGSMDKALTEMVKAGLVSYIDFNFRDRDEALRGVGTDNPHIVLFSEKDGFISILEDSHETYGLTYITLGGQSSLMSSNYMAAQMAAAGLDLTQEFVCFSLVDFDPSGYSLAFNFIEQLDHSGVKNIHDFRQFEGTYKRLDLVQPKNLSRDDIDKVKYNLPARIKRGKLCATWAANTGGVDGHGSRLYGLESDEVTQERIQELVAEAVTPYLRTPADVVARRAQMRKLEKSLTDFMVYKLLHPPQPPPPPS